MQDSAYICTSNGSADVLQKFWITRSNTFSKTAPPDNSWKDFCTGALKLHSKLISIPANNPSCLPLGHRRSCSCLFNYRLLISIPRCTTSTIVTVGAGVAAVAAAPVALAAAGFGAAGVAAGSIAAKFMSLFGVVPAGGVFAGLQSAGAAGIGVATKAGLFGAGAAAGKAFGPSCKKPCPC